MAEMMKALVKTQPGAGLEMTTRPIPEFGPYDVLIKTRAMSICGTDLHIYHWDHWSAGRIKPPIIAGHEFCGDVVALGHEVTSVKIGDYVSAESHIVCGVCDLCRTGNGHICPNTRIIGVDRDGCFAEYIALPAANVWIDPPEMPPEIATLQENFGNAVHTALSTPLVARKVLMTGCGPVGLMTIAVAIAAGARSIFVTDVSDYRLELARKLGAAVTVNVSHQDIRELVLNATNGEGVDVLLEMSGAPQAVIDGFSVLKKGGSAVLLGLPPEPFEFDLGNLVVLKGISVQGIAGRRLWKTWYEARGLLRGGAVDLSPIVTHRYKLEEFEKAFKVMENGKSGKVVLFP
jgi:threonine 3-dehydrogenase